MRVALATSSHEWADSVGDEEALAAELRRRGVPTDVVTWDSSQAPWTGYDLVVIRSTWDYDARYDEFLEWTTMVGERLRNRAAVVRWNTHKRYLGDLEAAGVRVVPSAIVEPGGRVDPSIDWQDIVVKPAVGHSARDLIRTNEPDEAGRHAERLGADVLIQPFVPEIDSGELSVVHFGGAYSHAVLKTPPKGEFRAQTHLGATGAAVEPTSAELALAEAALAASPGGPHLYSRVDMVGGDPPQLMELELTEPSLFLDLVPPATARFAAAIQAELG